MKLYTYKVKIGAPPQPQGLAVTAVDDTSITLQWTTCTESDFASTNLYRSTDGVTYGLPYVYDITTNTYVDSGLSSSTLYYYKITHEDIAGNESAFSVVVSQETEAPIQGLTWTPDQNPLPTAIEFSYGTPSVFDFDPYISGTPNSITVETGALPPNVTVVNQTLSYDGGGSSSGHTETGVSFKLIPNALLDFLDRINDPLVVWYHNFDTAAEVNAFRWSDGFSNGNDPLAVGNANSQYVQWISSGGADGGGYMQLTRSSSAMDGNVWWRPFSPLTGVSNGRGQDDPAANGTLTVGTMVATSGGSQTVSWGVSSNPKPGWYGHSSNQNSYFDGGDYWVQIRVMADPRRTTSGNIKVGKFTSFTTTGASNTFQELVTYGGHWDGAAGVGINNIHNVYQGWAYQPMVDVATGTPQNPNSPKWSYSFGWDTLLYHVVPGRHGVNETRYQVWAAHEGVTTYTLIWDVTYPAYYESGSNGYGSVFRPGWNAMLCWIYHNGATMSEFWQRFDQIIFKKGNGGFNPDTDGIRCPAV